MTNYMKMGGKESQQSFQNLRFSASVIRSIKSSRMRLVIYIWRVHGKDLTIIQCIRHEMWQGCLEHLGLVRMIILK